METKMLVNGKAMTNTEYLKLLKDARDALRVYKTTPEYASDQKDKEALKTRLPELVKQTKEFNSKTLKVTPIVFARVCLAIYKENNDVKKA